MNHYITDEKHKDLSEKYDHYVCEICMKIGAKEVISEFVNDLSRREWLESEDIDLLIKKWEEKLK